MENALIEGLAGDRLKGSRISQAETRVPHNFLRIFLYSEISP
ncbi:hypothetical protein [Chroococcidiopsis sp. CCNUC1]|nr:hypothetical protein [Chroococcidiopsis sp. CCNUC1]